MSKTVDEIEKLLYKHFWKSEYEKRWHGSDTPWHEWAEIHQPETVPGLGTVKVVKSYGGEGQGDQYWFVLQVQMEDGTDGFLRFFKKSGWYASHDGGYYDGDFTEVKPFERTVTVYE